MRDDYLIIIIGNFELESTAGGQSWHNVEKWEFYSLLEKICENNLHCCDLTLMKLISRNFCCRANFCNFHTMWGPSKYSKQLTEGVIIGSASLSHLHALIHYYRLSRLLIQTPSEIVTAWTRDLVQTWSGWKVTFTLWKFQISLFRSVLWYDLLHITRLGWYSWKEV